MNKCTPHSKCFLIVSSARNCYKYSGCCDEASESFAVIELVHSLKDVLGKGLQRKGTHGRYTEVKGRKRNWVEA